MRRLSGLLHSTSLLGRLVHDAKDLTSPLVHRRIPLEAIPEDEAECAAWLHKLYQEKVRVLKMRDRCHGYVQELLAVRQEQGFKRTVLSPVC